MTKSKRRPITPSCGKDFVIIAGLPMESFNFIVNEMRRDKTLPPALTIGLPAPLSDSAPLYTDSIARQLYTKLVDRWTRYQDGDDEEDGEGNSRGSGSKKGHPLPNSIALLYVPDDSQGNLLAQFGCVCYTKRLVPKGETEGTSIVWRHDNALTKEIVYKAREEAIKDINALRAELTHRTSSALGLPANNFFYPDKDGTIGAVYAKICAGQLSYAEVVQAVRKRKFMREMLHPRAFHGKPWGYYFQDCRARVFPPHDDHGSSWISDQEAAGAPRGVVRESVLDLQKVLAIRQRYRFGVTVRQGKLHYDVQYETPRKLHEEPMICSLQGPVRVTADHANVGVNDFIWAPSTGGRVQRSTG